MPNTLRGRLDFFRSNLRKPSFWIILATDIFLVVAAYCCAHLIRFPDFFSSAITRYPLASTLPLLIAVKIPVFFGFGLYRGMWRYTSLGDLLNVVKATLVSSLAIIAVILYIHRFQGFSRSVFVLDAILTFLLIGGHRLAIRFSYQKLSLFQPPRPQPATQTPSRKKRLLLIGAGDAAEQIIREIRNNPALPYTVVGMVDDNPAKVGLKIHNVPVVGRVDELEDLCRKLAAEELLIAISAPTGAQMKRLTELCRATRIEYKTLPGLGELINGRVSIKQIRDIAYADLLGRPEVHLDQAEIGRFLTGKTVMVTGAGGSIGSELCRQIARFKPARLILFDAGEENLYNIQMELRYEIDFPDCEAIMGRVQDYNLLATTMVRFRPAVIFHAAAYKHVPLVELNPWEAIVNNVTGSACLIEAAICHGVEKFVLVSTDKAVRPTNVMGATKRLTELIMLACTREQWDGTLYHAPAPAAVNHQTVFQAVRFGNVLGSSGSVIPLFRRQIELGGPVTVTDPEVTRYFMSIGEAARLIIQAGAMGRGGEIFILEMGEPIKIDKMARDLIRLSGREPDTEIEIRYIGLRPGEKLYEELITEGEGIVPTSHPKIMVLRGNGITYTEINRQIARLQEAAANFDREGIKQTLRELIPEYQPADQPPGLNPAEACSAPLHSAGNNG